MTTATAEETTSDQAPQPSAEDLAAEEAGFAEMVPSTAPVTETLKETVEDEPAPGVVENAAPVVAAAEPAKPIKLAEISDEAFQTLLKKATEVDEIKAAMESRFNGLGGKVGVVQQVLKDLQDRAKGGKPFQISKEDMKELVEEFPLFGEHTITGLNRALASLTIPQGSSGMKPDEVERLVSDRTDKIVAERLEAKEIKRLTKTMPDWKETVGPDPTTHPEAPVTPYRQWLRTQPDAYQQDINTSSDCDEILESIDRFKKATAPKPVEKPKGLTDREKQLRAAVPLKSAGTPVHAAATDEDSAMQEGFQRERARNS